MSRKPQVMVIFAPPSKLFLFFDWQVTAMLEWFAADRRRHRSLGSTDHRAL